ncbi:MAG TPA: hypothetical protein VGJ57_10865 [Nitrospirales bacterium]|jgi:hypothetical protein
MKKIAVVVSAFAFGLSLGIPVFAATPAPVPAPTPSVAPAAPANADNVQPVKGKVSKKTTHRKHAKKTQSPAPATVPAVQ